MLCMHAVQLAKEWMRRHIEGESQRVVDEGGIAVGRADPQRLIDALVGITASDSRSSHLGNGLQALLSQIAAPPPNQQLQSQQFGYEAQATLGPTAQHTNSPPTTHHASQNKSSALTTGCLLYTSPSPRD